MTDIIPRSLATLVLALCTSTTWSQSTGPSTTTVPYLLPTSAGVSTTSVLTVGDSIGGYRMVGVPDGLGLFAAEGQSNSFTLLMNHELGSTAGIIRAHGATGSFVSRWTIGSDLTVTSGRDHNQSAADQYLWNGSAYVPGPSAYGRFCSADLALPSAFRFDSLGTDARIFLNGEESGAEGRVFAHVVSGPEANRSYQLPYLGRFNCENAVACPFPQQKTIVVGTDDATPGQVYVYVGNKSPAGSEIERAGLVNGSLYAIAVSGLALEQRATPAGGGFSLVLVGAGNAQTGAQLQAASVAAGATEFLRPEDGAWDPRPGHQNDFYFNTTDRFNNPPTQDGRSRLYRLRFSDISNPVAGGQITAVLTGTEGQQMLDNLCIDTHGRILLQEDPGGQGHLGRIWLFDTGTAIFQHVAQFRSDLFGPGAPDLLTIDEESSGIIDARDFLGDGWFLFAAQAHYSIPGELVGGGQLLAMYVDPNRVPCRADINHDGTSDVPDIFAFLIAWFAGDPVAEFDGQPGITVPDIFAFLSLWFAGCS